MLIYRPSAWVSSRCLIICVQHFEPNFGQASVKDYPCFTLTYGGKACRHASESLKSHLPLQLKFVNSQCTPRPAHFYGCISKRKTCLPVWFFLSFPTLNLRTGNNIMREPAVLIIDWHFTRDWLRGLSINFCLKLWKIKQFVQCKFSRCEAFIEAVISFLSEVGLCFFVLVFCSFQRLKIRSNFNRLKTRVAFYRS